MPKPYHKNPRQITVKQFDNLADTLARLGDLSGVVHELNTDEIIGGNQRIKVFGIEKCEIELTQTFDVPDAQGTVALGYIVWEGKRYAYRQVRWDARMAEEANIVANRAGGDWDYDILANEFNTEDLLAWGFEERDFRIDSASMIDAEGDEDGEGGSSDDSLIALTDVTIAEPRHQVQIGEVYKVGPHILVCAEVIDGWQSWVEFLKPGWLLAPYPGPFVALSLKAKEKSILLVQPDPYIAGHILDRYEDIHGKGANRRAKD